MVNEDAALLDRHVTSVTPSQFSTGVYTSENSFAPLYLNLMATRPAVSTYPTAVLTATGPFTFCMYLTDGSCTGPIQTLNYQVNWQILEAQ